MENSPLLLSNQICFPIYSVSRLITQAYKPYLDKLGITYPQYLVLLVLWENDKLNVNEISKRLILNTNTISPLLKRMQNLEIIRRTRSTIDERQVIVELTEKGYLMKEEASSIPIKLTEQILEKNIKMDELVHLKETMTQMVKMLQSINSKEC